MIINLYNLTYRRFERIDGLPVLDVDDLEFDGTEQIPVVRGYNAATMVKSGDTSARDVGDYTLTLTPAEGYAWPDSTTVPIDFEWHITKKAIAEPVLTVASKTFIGDPVSPDAEYDTDWVDATGDLSAVNVGSYSITYALKEPANTEWVGGSVANVSRTWSVAVLKLPKPTYASGNATYDGNTKNLTVTNFVSRYMTQGGTTTATNAGSYTATYTLNSTTNSTWSDDSTSPASVAWTISRSAVAVVPTVKTNPTYNGAAQSPAWNNYNTSYMTIGGSSSGTNAGNYNATFTLNSNYAWSGGATDVKTVTWTMQRLKVTKPTLKGNPTYSGSAQSPTWNNYNTTYMTIGGTYSATNAGSYNATFTLKSNWAWSDGGTGVLTIGWTMNKAAGSVSFSASSITVTAGSTATFTVTRAGNGAITATSNATGYATVSVSGTTVTVRGVAIGSATVTVNVAAGSNHNAASKAIGVTTRGANIYVWGYTNSVPKTYGQYQELTRYGFGGSATNSTAWSKNGMNEGFYAYSYQDDFGIYHSEGLVDWYYEYNRTGISGYACREIVRLNKNPVNLTGYNKMRFNLYAGTDDSSEYRAKNGAMYRECGIFVTTNAAPTNKTGTVAVFFSGTVTRPASGPYKSGIFDIDISGCNGNQYIYAYIVGSYSAISDGGWYRYGISLFFHDITTQADDPQQLKCLLFN